MKVARQRLEAALLEIAEVSIRPYRDTDLICVLYRDREFAHFHGEDVLDIRLTPKIIRDYGMSREITKRFHPNRSPNSRWICLAIRTEDQLVQLKDLARLAIGALA